MDINIYANPTVELKICVCTFMRGQVQMPQVEILN